jgi:hypothetical protein
MHGGVDALRYFDDVTGQSAVHGDLHVVKVTGRRTGRTDVPLSGLAACRYGSHGDEPEYGKSQQTYGCQERKRLP